jgi:hypothetical protein
MLKAKSAETFQGLHDSGTGKTGIPISELSRNGSEVLVASQRRTPSLNGTRERTDQIAPPFFPVRLAE